MLTFSELIIPSAIMLSRLISGGGESDFILHSAFFQPSASPADKQFLKTCSDDSVLMSTSPKQILPAVNFNKIIDLKDFLGWISGTPLKFPDCVLNPGKEVI